MDPRHGSRSYPPGAQARGWPSLRPGGTSTLFVLWNEKGHCFAVASPCAVPPSGVAGSEAGMNFDSFRSMERKRPLLSQWPLRVLVHP